MQTIRALQILLLTAIIIIIPGPVQASRAFPFYSHEGMVVSAEPHASAAGFEVLRAGGNAADAAAAVGFALAATFPSAGNLGGGGFLVYRRPDGRVFTLNYREKALCHSRSCNLR